MLRDILNRHPRLKLMARQVHATLFPDRAVSTAYQHIQSGLEDTEASRLRDSWQSDIIPARQRELVDKQLAEYRQGKAIDVFDVMVEALRSIEQPDKPRTLLEIGCSSGFYSEVIKIKKLPITYSGCDYSPAFINLGKKHHPDISLSVGDATALSFADESFDIVVSGCCLLHIPEFTQAIAETARVAQEYAIFHRTSVVTGLPHQYFRKQAYGVETVEIHFNEEQLLGLFQQHGLELLKTITLSQEADANNSDVWHYNRTYVCRKIKHAT